MAVENESPQSTARMALWAVSEYFAYPLMMFAATPLFLHNLGDTQYGQWMLLLTLVGFGGLGGLGMGHAATHSVASALGRSDPAQATRDVRACLSVAVIGSLALSVVMIACTIIWGDRIFGAMGEHGEVAVLGAFAVGITVLQQLDSIFAGTLRGFERFNKSAKIEITVKFGLVLLALFASWITGNVIAVYAVTILLILGGMLVKRHQAARLLGVISLMPLWSATAMRKALSYGGWVWLQGVGSLIFSTADRLLVGSLLGAQPLAYYSIALQLAQQVHTVPAAGGQVLLPRVARTIRSADSTKRLVFGGSGVMAGLAITAALVLYFAGQSLLSLWVGAERAKHASEVLPWLLAAFTLTALPIGVHYTLMGWGKVRFVALLNIFAGLLSLGVAAIGVFYMGIVGAALGRIAYGCFVLLLIPKTFMIEKQIQQSEMVNL